MKSAFLKLNKDDVVRGLIVTVLAAVLTTVVEWLSSPDFTFYGFDWMALLRIALVAGASYLLKNVLTAENGKFAGIL